MTSIHGRTPSLIVMQSLSVFATRKEGDFECFTTPSYFS
jgi:hypothetical protein